MRRRGGAAVLAAALAVASFGAFASPASGQSANLCLNAKVVVAGQALVDQAQCVALPPA